MERVQNEESEKKEFKKLLTKQIELKNSNDLLSLINHISNDLNSFYNLLDDYDKKELLRFLIKEIQVNNGEKTKDRTIKKIVYEFDQDFFEDIRKIRVIKLYDHINIARFFLFIKAVRTE